MTDKVHINPFNPPHNPQGVNLYSFGDSPSPGSPAHSAPDTPAKSDKEMDDSAQDEFERSESPDSPKEIVRPSSLAETKEGWQSSLYIGNLTWWTTYDDLESFLKNPYGKVEEIRIFDDVRNGKSKGYALAQFADCDIAYDVKSDIMGKSIHGSDIVVSFASDNTIRKLIAVRQGITVYQPTMPMHMPMMAGRGRGNVPYEPPQPRPMYQRYERTDNYRDNYRRRDLREESDRGRDIDYDRRRSRSPRDRSPDRSRDRSPEHYRGRYRSRSRSRDRKRRYR